MCVWKLVIYTELLCICMMLYIHIVLHNIIAQVYVVDMDMCVFTQKVHNQGQ